MLANPKRTKDEIVQWIREYFAANGNDCCAVIGISGGKDSSVVAALCVEALGAERVIGVLMPNGRQKDIADSKLLVDTLGIASITVDIGGAYSKMVDVVGRAMPSGVSNQAAVNLPPRLRMATLYMVAQSLARGGRVANTCNRSEDYVGYSTKFGDSAGDFSPLANIMVHEVRQIGYELPIPRELVDKTPSDGLCGKTDEDNLGFTYMQLDNYIMHGSSGDEDIDKVIAKKHTQNLHKLNPMPAYGSQPQGDCMEEIAIVRCLQNASGAISKMRVLQAFKDVENFRKILYYALNPMLTYKISEQTLRTPVEYDPAITITMTDIFEICELLAKRKALDAATVYQVRVFVQCLTDPESSEFYIELLSKTLRLGVTAKTVNKVIPGLIPEWEVQQAYPIDKYPVKDGTEFWLTQKLNGVRATYYKGQLFARSGVPYEGLGHILDALKIDDNDSYVFDGELTLRDKGALSDNEAFRKATGIINSEDADKTAVCYTIFDVLTTEEFDAGVSEGGYGYRRSFLDQLHRFIPQDGRVNILPVLYHGKDQTKIDELLEQMVREDKEGLMVNFDVPYKRKRHNGILKVKRFYTMDLHILRCEEGSGRLAGTLGAFVLDYEGNEVNVGSGFSDEQRTAFWAAKDEMPGRLCEVKYKEISYDKNTGAESLQFPVFISIRTDKDEVSYG